MKTKYTEQVEGLLLKLHGVEIGVVVHYASGRNVLTYAPSFVATPTHLRDIFTLTQLSHRHYFDRVLSNSQKVPPVLSNLLPEGALRAWVAQELGVHVDNEFPLLMWMGKNLPGALVTEPLGAGEVPDWALDHYEHIEAIQIDVRYTQQQRFSLAGMQMKFSSVRTRDGRFNINQTQGEDDWIIKTPSTVHKNVPYNEYSTMLLAQAIGVTIPEIKLVPLAELDNLPDIQLPDESFAYAIKRFDRQDGRRIHTEDFSQIFELYPQQKYLKKNHEQIADVLYRYSDDGLADVQQMARRMLANILLANGDAHLKNWTIHYPQNRTPRLSPVYDILSTLPYMHQETDIALNMAKIKNWYEIDLSHFRLWAERAGLPWQAIHPHLLQTIELARSRWPQMLKTLPMAEPHKKRLMAHWCQLKSDIRL